METTGFPSSGPWPLYSLPYLSVLWLYTHREESMWFIPKRLEEQSLSGLFLTKGYFKSPGRSNSMKKGEVEWFKRQVRGQTGVSQEWRSVSGSLRPTVPTYPSLLAGDNCYFVHVNDRLLRDDPVIHFKQKTPLGFSLWISCFRGITNEMHWVSWMVGLPSASPWGRRGKFYFRERGEMNLTFVVFSIVNK